MHPLPRKVPKRAPYPNYRWFADLTGKMQIRVWSGAQYGGVVLDDQSNLKQGVTVKYKSEFPNEYDRIKRKLGVSPKYFRSDCGGENISKKF
eukprot:3893688-Rhodomonas_salina.1